LFLLLLLLCRRKKERPREVSGRGLSDEHIAESVYVALDDMEQEERHQTALFGGRPSKEANDDDRSSASRAPSLSLPGAGRDSGSLAAAEVPLRLVPPEEEEDVDQEADEGVVAMDPREGTDTGTGSPRRESACGSILAPSVVEIGVVDDSEHPYEEAKDGTDSRREGSFYTAADLPDGPRRDSAGGSLVAPSVVEVSVLDDNGSSDGGHPHDPRDGAESRREGSFYTADNGMAGSLLAQSAAEESVVEDSGSSEDHGSHDADPPSGNSSDFADPSVPQGSSNSRVRRGLEPSPVINRARVVSPAVSSDHTVDTMFFGTQRVVMKKPRSDGSGR
jgi:hypothetical protein